MRLYIYFISFFSQLRWCAKQHSASIEKLNKGTIPYVKVSELNRVAEKNNIVFLDAREPKEYKVSHIQDAILVGFNYFN
jgi:predicted sulfurtransferase